MGTKIEWTDATWNPVTGCSKISAGCQNCYAERMAKRLAGRNGYPADDPFQVTIHRDRLDEPFKWKKSRKVFICSMSDLFHDQVPFEFIKAVLARTCGTNTNMHKFMMLTKRPVRMKDFFEWLSTEHNRGQFTIEWPLPNVWLGVTAENQEQADKRIPILLRIPAAVRFVSVEPMLGPVDLTRIRWAQIKHSHFTETWSLNNVLTKRPADEYNPEKGRLDWVICGGESGPGARPMHPDFVRSLRDQCRSAEVPFFFKQWGEWIPYEYDPQPPFLTSQHGAFIDGHCLPPITDNINENVNGWMLTDDTQVYRRVGKKAAGRRLDGEIIDEYPITE